MTIRRSLIAEAVTSQREKWEEEIYLVGKWKWRRLSHVCLDFVPLIDSGLRSLLTLLPKGSPMALGDPDTLCSFPPPSSWSSSDNVWQKASFKSYIVRILGLSKGLWPGQEQTEFIFSPRWGGGSLDFRYWRFSTSKHPWERSNRQSLDRAWEPWSFVTLQWLVMVSRCLGPVGFQSKDSELTEFSKKHRWPSALLKCKELQTRFLQYCMDVTLPLYLHPATSQNVCVKWVLDVRVE